MSLSGRSCRSLLIESGRIAAHHPTPERRRRAVRGEDADQPLGRGGVPEMLRERIADAFVAEAAKDEEVLDVARGRLAEPLLGRADDPEPGQFPALTCEGHGDVRAPEGAGVVTEGPVGANVDTEPLAHIVDVVLVEVAENGVGLRPDALECGRDALQARFMIAEPRSPAPPRGPVNPSVRSDGGCAMPRSLCDGRRLESGGRGRPMARPPGARPAEA